jgi:hypothetical protein
MARIVALAGSVIGALAPALAAAHPADELPPGQWMVLSLNTIDDVDPCPAQDCSYSAVEGVSATIDDWCGGALASGYGMLGALVVWGGGHNGYFGSEVYVFDIDSQLWERVSEPFDDGSGSVAPACSDDGVYPDGSACPTHTYDRVDYHPGTNSFVILFATPDPVCGGCDDPNVHLFGFDDGTWSLGAAHPMPSPFTGASTAYDASRDSYWLLPAYNGFFSQYDAGADVWTAHQQHNIDIDAVSAIDPGRDLFVTVDGRGTHTVIVHDLANPTNLGTTVTVDGTSPIMDSAAQGFEWDPVSQQFVGWGGGTEVWTLVPPDGDWATQTWTWLRVDAAAENTVVPTEPNANGTYSRWRHVPSLNVFVVVNRVGDPVFAYRLSDDPGVGPNDDGGTDTTASGSDSSPGTSETAADGGVDAGATGSLDGGSGSSTEGSGSGGANEGGAGGCGCATGRTRAAPLGLAMIGFFACGLVNRAARRAARTRS